MAKYVVYERDKSLKGFILQYFFNIDRGPKLLDSHSIDECLSFMERYKYVNKHADIILRMVSTDE